MVFYTNGTLLGAPLVYTNGTGGAPLVRNTSGMILMAHPQCTISGQNWCAITSPFPSSASLCIAMQGAGLDPYVSCYG